MHNYITNTILRVYTCGAKFDLLIITCSRERLDFKIKHTHYFKKIRCFISLNCVKKVTNRNIYIFV